MSPPSVSTRHSPATCTPSHVYLAAFHHNVVTEAHGRSCTKLKSLHIQVKSNSSIGLNKTPTWCNKMHILLVQTFSTCFRHHAPIIRSIKYWHHNYLYWWLPCQYFILLMMGAWRPKHVEKVCGNKICILLHHVGVLFNLILWCTETLN